MSYEHVRKRRLVGISRSLLARIQTPLWNAHSWMGRVCTRRVSILPQTRGAPNHGCRHCPRNVSTHRRRCRFLETFPVDQYSRNNRNIGFLDRRLHSDLNDQLIFPSRAWTTAYVSSINGIKIRRKGQVFSVVSTELRSINFREGKRTFEIRFYFYLFFFLLLSRNFS